VTRNGLLAVCGALLALLTMAAAAPSRADVRVLQMNLCNSGLAGCYTGRAVDIAAAVIRAQAPDVVTLNEVCRSDATVLARAFGVATFRSVPDRRTGGVTRCRNGEAYGIAILTRREASQVTGGTYPMQNPADPEQRAWLCLNTADFAACTTHLDATSPAVARRQCQYVLGTVLPTLRQPVVLGGDFNLRADMRTCLPPGERRADDGGLQNVVVSAQFTITSQQRIDMRKSTDHPGLLVTLAAP
jgi:endonuclease/exonuclease/phosphatase (EEP) superfamily protein YafD